MKRLALLAVVLLALAAPAGASAAEKNIWHVTTYDTLVSGIAGYPLTIDVSDDDVEWMQINGGDGVLGFTALYATPTSTIYNPHDGYSYWTYRRIWLAPRVWRSLQDIQANGFRASMDYYGAAIALMTLDHEAQHWRLMSGDEGRVNACALADLPRLLSSSFGVPPTVQQTVTVPQDRQVQQRYRVKIRGHLRWRTRWVWKTFYVDQLQTVSNPVYSNLVTAAQAFYRSQPYPYNAGTCW